MKNLNQSKNNLRYAKLLKPARVYKKLKLMLEFLRWKVAGYETLRADIEVVKAEMSFAEVGPQ